MMVVPFSFPSFSTIHVYLFSMAFMCLHTARLESISFSFVPSKLRDNWISKSLLGSSTSPAPSPGYEGNLIDSPLSFVLPLLTDTTIL